jgi:hypothetical protein
VIRYERTLPVGVTRHLGHIEETILESVGWQEGSPVFALLADPAKVRDLLALFRRPAQVPTSPRLASPRVCRVACAVRVVSCRVSLVVVLMRARV